MIQGITKKIKIIMDIIIITHMEVQKNTERKKEEQIKNIIQKIIGIILITFMLEKKKKTMISSQSQCSPIVNLKIMEILKVIL